MKQWPEEWTTEPETLAPTPKKVHEDSRTPQHHNILFQINVSEVLKMNKHFNCEVI
jgi:hypothetical protein